MAEPTKPLAPVTSRRSPGLGSAITKLSVERSPPGGVTLHPARIGGGAAAPAFARRGGEAPLAPIGVNFDDMTAALQFLHGRLRQPAFDHQNAGPRGARPERDREMLGVPRGSVDRLLQIHPGMNVAHEQLRRPLILLVAAGRTPGEIRLAVAQRERGRERGARPLAGSKRRRMTLLQPEHLRARAEAEAELGNDGRRLQPAAGRRRRYRVAGRIDDIEMHGIAAHLADASDGRLARAHAADGAALPLLATQLHHRAETGDRAGPQFERGLLVDELAPLLVVGVGKERRGRHFDKIGIAIEFFAIGVGELRALDQEVDEIGARGIGAVEVETLEQRQLLQHHRTLRPWARLADGVAAVVVGERRLDMSMPARHVLAREHAAMGLTAGVHHGLGAAEAVECWRKRASPVAMVALARSTSEWPWSA